MKKVKIRKKLPKSETARDQKRKGGNEGHFHHLIIYFPSLFFTSTVLFNRLELLHKKEPLFLLVTVYEEIRFRSTNDPRLYVDLCIED